MARELKFRYWQKYMIGDEMVYPNPGSNMLLTMDGRLVENSRDGLYDYSDPVMQFTGLKDKNGVDIYEDDIVLCKKVINGNLVDAVYEKGYVDFVHGAFCLHRKEGLFRPFKDWLEDYEYEVLGNIYQHKYLLE